MRRVQIVDSHTGGEPTRLVIGGGPELTAKPLAERLKEFRDQYDRFRSAIVNEPRGSEAIVGALLTPPEDADCQLGVIFFNNVGYLGMCGHGTIGLCATLAQLGKIGLGDVKIETPVGKVSAFLHSESEVTVRNVPSYRYRENVEVKAAGRTFSGDVAYGGNWFFFTKGDSPIPIDLAHLEELTRLAWQIRKELQASRVTGANGAEIDHIELFTAPQNKEAQLRNFVLCPGKSYDRSPCGTGTSAKMACLYAEGKLKPGEVFVQESICGSLFHGSIEVVNSEVIPSIRGSAFITAQMELILQESDPFCWGIPG